MSEETPSAGEVWRLLNKIDRRLDAMAREFVRVDVFEARQATDVAESRGVQNELHKQAKRFENLEKAIDDIEERRRVDIRWALALLIPIALGLLLTLAGNGALLR